LNLGQNTLLVMSHQPWLGSLLAEPSQLCRFESCRAARNLLVMSHDHKPIWSELIIMFSMMEEYAQTRAEGSYLVWYLVVMEGIRSHDHEPLPAMVDDYQFKNLMLILSFSYFSSSEKKGSLLLFYTFTVYQGCFLIKQTN